MALATTERVRVPHRFTPRPYQVPLFAAFDAGYKRFVVIHHRRAGKDKTCFNAMVWQAVERVGAYYYVLPTYSQGKKVIWDGRDAEGMRTLDHLPRALVAKTNETEMSVTLRNGSRIQVVGSDNIDSLVGTNPVGLVFSEYSLQSPDAWDYLRPILRENGGWAIFNGTPRGHNHLYRLYNTARNNPEWWVSKLGWQDTGAVTPEDIAAERAAGMSDDLIAQEYGVDFEVANQGSYFGRLMAEARAAGRVGQQPHDPRFKVHTVMDIGVSDYTAIGFVQVKGGAVLGIDYYANHGEGFAHYARILDEKARTLGYRYGSHIAPHDAGHRSKNDAVTYADEARQYGYRLTVLSPAPFEAGIEVARSFLPRMYWDEGRCAAWVEALESYSKKWNAALGVWSDEPLHNQYSHPADMTRYIAQAEKAGLLQGQSGGTPPSRRQLTPF